MEAIVLPDRTDPRLISITDATKNIIQTNDEVTITAGNITAKLKNIKGKKKMYEYGYIFLDDIPVSYKDPRLISIELSGRDIKHEFAEFNIPKSEEKKSEIESKSTPLTESKEFKIISPATLEKEQSLSILIKKIDEKIKKLSKDLSDPDNYYVNTFEDTPVSRALTTKEDILHVTHKIKSVGGVALSPKTERIHIGNYHAELSTIKINHFPENKGIFESLPHFAITLTNKKGDQEYYFIKDKELIQLITELTTHADKMNLVEYSLLKSKIKEEAKNTYPLKAWDTGWEDPETHGLYYDKINDPLVLEQYINRALPLSQEEKTQYLTVLDIGAGKGRLAYKIIDETLTKAIPIHYILVEPSQHQLNIARIKLEEFSTNPNCKITFVNSTLEDLTINEKAHCIVSTGGPLNMNVVTRDAAIANVKRMQQLLLPKGILIATGQTALLVKGKHFEQAGLNVLSYAAPCVIPKELENNEFMKKSKIAGGFFDHFQRYVCQKTEMEEKVSHKRARETGDADEIEEAPEKKARTSNCLIM